MSREAMQMALEALEDSNDVARMEFSDEDYYSEAINALRQALVDADDTSENHVDETVKSEHEPVAWANSFDLQNFDMKVRTCPDLHHTVPLYTTPPQRTWVGLTADEVYECWLSGDVVAAVEAKLKEKNT
jgi:hypothetical protein